MSRPILNQDLSCSAPFVTPSGALGAAVLVGKLFIGCSVKQALVVGLCAEIAARVATYAVQYFTQQDVISRTASRAGRLFGGVLLGNVVLQTVGFVPLASGASSFFLSLAGMVYTDLADYISYTST